MVQQLNPEFIPKIKASIEELEGNTVPSIRKGMDNIEEMTEASGSQKFINSGKSFAEGTAALLQRQIWLQYLVVYTSSTLSLMKH